MMMILMMMKMKYVEGAKMLRYRAADGIEKSAKSAVGWM